MDEAPRISDVTFIQRVATGAIGTAIPTSPGGDVDIWWLAAHTSAKADGTPLNYGGF